MAHPLKRETASAQVRDTEAAVQCAPHLCEVNLQPYNATPHLCAVKMRG